ncbi:hypothetical protein SNOG_00329 [Parastagonospora nodorum SN15]|uniref:CENP-T/Histone H4 histone fold domain-containing protein n=1 Tax=Phaeosphaeria nodorum (strain SN15 / ATCC MYA-4574 / FGSC 10173) TaxID=321614 RepID=Q0V6N5_PHANO|nr:hypothetical protein SNOG_00329 [Parastagonospora nodorum SN15]EAT91824.2 hypothetical protein SNOG_00329 [Parastagonospora nodorum SN15]
MSESARKKQRPSPDRAPIATPDARIEPKRHHFFAPQAQAGRHAEDQQLDHYHRDEWRRPPHMRFEPSENEPMPQEHQETIGDEVGGALARDTKPVEPSPQADRRRTRHSALDLPDVEDGPDPAAPRLSMAIDDMYDDDSYHEHPPRQSFLPDLPDDVDGGTVQSLEFGRRAISEDPRFMYPGRISERFADLSELGAVEEEFEIDGTFINRRDGLLDQTINEALDEDDTTTQIRALTGRRDGRPSDVDLGVFGDAEDDNDEPTFRFNIPERIRAPQREEPTEEQDFEDALEDALPTFANDDEELLQPEGDEQDEVTAALNGDVTSEPPGIQGWESEPGLNDADLAQYREEESAMDRSLQTQSPERPAAAKQANVRKAKELRISQRGLEYPSFPAASVKKLALGFMKSQGSKGQLNKESLNALVKVTDDFFEQIGIDLAAYAQHGGRKMIEESDVIALMKSSRIMLMLFYRTRKTTSNNTIFSLAQKMLPRELLQQLRMEPPQKLRGQKRKRMNTIQEEDEG